MNELHRVARMGGIHLPALRIFYIATLGSSRSMQLEGKIGGFAPGAEADFAVAATYGAGRRLHARDAQPA